MFPNMGASSVTVYGEMRVAKFARKHADARKPLARFLAIVRQAAWSHFPEVKQSFPATDYVPATQMLIFDIGGNRYRLVARVDFELQALLIRAVMTHEQYDRETL
jgi:mRNA interferase HigB